MSPRRFDGWEPQEIHEHFDAEGVKTGHTVITREPEWDDESRGRALRLAEFEAGLCPCGCGLQMSVSHDKTAVMRVESFTCVARRAITIHERNERDKHKDAKPDRKTGALWNDGVNYYAVPHDQD